jgi:hypothetical protein
MNNPSELWMRRDHKHDLAFRPLETALLSGKVDAIYTQSKVFQHLQEATGKIAMIENLARYPDRRVQVANTPAVPEFTALLKLLLIVLISGVAFYSQVEGWSYLDALYFSGITMATIGYGDLTPATTAGTVFTMFFALVSVGIFVSLAAKIGAILLEKERQKTRKWADKIRHDEKAT